ncbi:hypothetical protein [Kineosporia sp. A_224]|uniref:hypothetical protein n=1 Tax=Kineosporia sp. A_224 TaxID=1962180 RepID=UPI000B4A579C|nr:hypothetical protein [Kineosporia sp. A_224]
MGTPEDAVLRRGVLAVAVLDDVDLEPTVDGVLVPSPTGAARVLVGWDRVGQAAAGLAPESAVARLRIATLLRTEALLADGLPGTDWAGRHVRALALPVGHPLHPGRGWAVEGVLGGVLDVGLGLVDLPWTADGVLPLPPGAAAGRGTGTDLPAAWWPMARDHARRMGALAAVRVGRGSGPDDAPGAGPDEAPGARPAGTLRPVGGCDVLTLLATRPLRAALAASDGSGMRAVAVPTRSRGWYDLRRVDPAFAGAVWSATEEPVRGLPRPLLVTRDEVALARAGGDPAGEALDLPPALRPGAGRERRPGRHRADG